MKRCPECRGFKVIDCPVCGSSGKDPRNSDMECSYCNGKGYIPCNICDGTGELDDNDDYRA